ncbi:MAG TPA: preprotein translocase subunit SecE [Deltaproteobacteria bacterium]|nr:preprotein translocase subunit SecE [Deltaproteobacteria bacterium]
MKNKRFVLMSFFTGAVLVGMSLQGLGAPLLANFEISNPEIALGLSATTAVAFIVGIATFFILSRHPVAYRFTDEVVTEFRKVTWPSKEETVRSTTVVVVFTIIVAGALAGYDWIWGEITSRVLFTES